MPATRSTKSKSTPTPTPAVRKHNTPQFQKKSQTPIAETVESDVEVPLPSQTTAAIISSQRKRGRKRKATSSDAETEPPSKRAKSTVKATIPNRGVLPARGDHPAIKANLHASAGAFDELVASNDRSDVRNSVSMFANASDVVVRGGKFYCAGGNILIAHQDFHRTPKGIVEGVEVFTAEDVRPKQEIYKDRGYRIYSSYSTTRARAVKVKLYEGSRAKERCSAAAEVNRKLMHPNVLHLIGVSPLHSEPAFLVFDDDNEWAVESMIASALCKGLNQGLHLGLQTVAGLSSGLDYLRTLLYPFASVGLDHFAVHRSRDGNILISFDPEILPDETREQDRRSGAFDGGSELAIFHGLCQKTFDAARKVHYKFPTIQPTYIDEFDIHHDLEQDRFEECEVDDGTLPDVSFTTLCIPSSPRPPPKSTPRAKPRRELVWKYQNHETVSLENISRQFNDFLRTSSTELAFNRRRGRYTTKTAHRCPGYTRIEITLTPDIARSALVSHLTPTPHEICPVCKETVKDAEIFACVCGGDDNESIPTVRCSTCLDWHHRPCVIFFEDEDRSFVCQRCQAGPSVPQGAAAANNGSHPGMPIPLDKNRFLTTYTNFCIKKPLKVDPRDVTIENRRIDLHSLHVEVVKEGGQTHVSQKELWTVIGGRLGFIQFPATDSEPARSGQGIGLQLAQMYQALLQDFDNWYTAQIFESQKSQLAHLQAQMNSRWSPQQTQQVIAMSRRSVLELRSLGVDEKAIQFVEANRVSLLRLLQEQSTFQVMVRNANTSQGAEPQTQAIKLGGGGQPQGQPQPPRVAAPGMGSPGTSFPQGMQQPPDAQLRNTLAAARVVIQRLKDDWTTNHMPALRQIEIPMGQIIEYNQRLENAFGLASETDEKFQIIVTVLQKEDIVRRLIAIICTVQYQRSLSSMGSPRHIITLETLRSMVGELQRISKTFNLPSANMRMKNNQRLGITMQAQQQPHHHMQHQQVMRNNTMSPPNTAMGTRDIPRQARSPVHRPPNPGPPTLQPQQQQNFNPSLRPRVLRYPA